MHVLVVDGSREVAPADGGLILAWKGYGEEPPIISIARYVESHAERLRATYLRFVHDLGERIVAGRPLREHFDTGDGFSLWWMHRVPEKSPFKSARIVDCLRLLALEELLKDHHAERVTLHTSDAPLSEAVAGLCHALGIAFAHVRVPRPVGRWSLRRIYEALPQTLQGFFSFRHLFLRWRFRRLRPFPWFGGSHAVFACSYFYHLDPDASRRGAFHSHQWERLPECLHEHGIRVNWLHHYLPHEGRTVEESASLLEAFNRDSERQGRHAFLETFLSARVIAAIAGRWLRLHIIGRRLRRVSTVFHAEGSAANFWPLLKEDWWNSVHGTAAVSNCAWYQLFDRALEDLPRQDRGVYLFEGQGWECALVHAWRKHGHGEIIAVPHSSMPFWYLNIYDDPRCLESDGCRKPLPDRWALNGRMAWRALTGAGYPEERLVAVEALRYTYLDSFLTRARSRRADAAPARTDAPRLLVLGDFTREQTFRMLSRLEAAAPLLEHAPSITVKLHPACRIARQEVPHLKCDFTNQALGDILGDFDVAFCSNTTSAGLDALLAGLPVVAFLDDEGLNQSPLRGAEHVTYVNTPEELARALNVAAGRRADAAPDEFFWIDSDLPRWQNVLVSAGAPHV